MTERRRSEVSQTSLGFRGAPANAPAEDFEIGYREALVDIANKIRYERNTWTRDGGGYDSGVIAGLNIALEIVEPQ